MIGQGLDRFLDGRMSLWECDVITAAWNAKQPNPGGLQNMGPAPSDADIEAMRDATAATIAAAQARASVH